MRFEGDGWVIENLSHTNPLVINGQILAEGAQPRPLREEDRLEIGEFVLSYHER
jgi:predicted component of type VI protein secretion system